MAKQDSRPSVNDSPARDRAHKKSPQVPPERRAWKSPLAVIVFLVIAALGAAADLASKDAVFESFLNQPQLPDRLKQVRAEHLAAGMSGDTYSVLHDPEAASLLQRPVAPGVKFTLSTNPGIVFGTTAIPRPVVNAATALTILFVFFFFATSDRGAKLMHVGLACIVGGAIGNLYDRLFAVVQVPGGLEPITKQVRDFIDMSEIGYVWVFNIADALLVIGVLAIILSWITASLAAKRQAAKEAA